MMFCSTSNNNEVTLPGYDIHSDLLYVHTYNIVRFIARYGGGSLL